MEPRTPVALRCERKEHAGWWICPPAIRPGDVVYSFGVGGDLAFERTLAGEYGARVFAFDPAPAVEATAESAGAAAGPPPRGAVQVEPLTVGGREERRRLPLPTGGTVEARVLRLPSHMRMLGHRRLDVIRLDVPGAEAEVIADLIRMDVDVQQLLIRFHQPVTPDGRDRIEAAVGALTEHGYRVFHRSPDRRVFSFVRTDVIRR